MQHTQDNTEQSQSSGEISKVQEPSQPSNSPTEQPSISTTRLETLTDLQRKVTATASSQEERLYEFQTACRELFLKTAQLVDYAKENVGIGRLNVPVIQAVCAILVAYTMLELPAPENTADLWGDTSVPSIDLMYAKLVRYSSNIFAVSLAYPESCLDSNMDYDLRQYLTFLDILCKGYGIDLMKLMLS